MALWTLLGLGLLVVATLEYGKPDQVRDFTAVGFGAFCLLTAFWIAISWKAGRWLGAIGGFVLVLYALALVLLGTEDVGGPWISVPASIILGGFGAWNIVATEFRA